MAIHPHDERNGMNEAPSRGFRMLMAFWILVYVGFAALLIVMAVK